MQSTRRTALKLFGGASVAGGASAAGLLLTSTPAVAATTSLTASNVTFDSNAGQLQSLYVQPDMDYEWSGLEAEPDTVAFNVAVRLPDASDSGKSSFKAIGSESTDISSSNLSSSGMKEYAFTSQQSVLGHQDIATNGSDFEPQGDGSSKTTTVGVRVETVITDVDGTTYSTADNTDGSPTATFDVTLNDEPGRAKGGGSANPGGSAK